MHLVETQGNTDLETLIVTWQNPDTRTYFRIGLLRHTLEDLYSFEYVNGIETVEDFTPLVGLEDMAAIHFSEKLFPVFAERIMDSRRPGFDAWLESLRTDRSASPMEVLARSNGKRGSDTLQMFPLATPDAEGLAQVRFFVHGIRHLPGALQRVDGVSAGQALHIVDDSTNEVDPRALIVAADGGGLGWVPGPMLSYVRILRDSSHWKCEIEQVNPVSAGPHQRLLVVVEGEAPERSALIDSLLDSPSI